MSTVAPVIHLSTVGTSLVLDLSDGRLPVVLHWGAALGDLDDAALADLRLAAQPQPIGFSVDDPVRVAVVPEQSAGWLGTPGLAGHRAGRDFSPAFRVHDVTRERGRRLGPTGQREQRPGEAPVDTTRVVVSARDDDAGLALTWTCELHDTGVARQRSEVSNLADEPYTVDALATFWPVPERTTELLDLTGHHLRERSPQRTAFTQGLRVRENRTGRTGFDAAYLTVAGTPAFDDARGEVWGVHVAWSGNHRTVAERTFHGVSLLGGGELLLPGEVELARGERYASPWLYAAHGEGLDEVSARFHAYLRARPQHPRRPRPVLVNTWEAVYFDHDLDRLTALARAAARVGVERYVLDDGWFGGRRDDTSSLGDWTVSDDVWPDGLGPLVDTVTGLGMEFGLWVEPEMVNEDSELARAHPEWLMAPGARLPGRARHQQVLDLAAPGAFEHVLGRLDALLTTYDIAYLKWDHNRDLVQAGHQSTGRAGTHDQTLAAYRLMDTLRARHPRLEIESCASGGGRVDLEVLERTDRVWASDCIDAHERLDILRWTNLLIPAELIGSHIGTDEAHTTGRVLPLDFRAATALLGHLGIEWDLAAASDDELDRLARWVALHKELRPLLHTGRVVHASTPDEAYRLTGVVAPDGARAVYVLAAAATSASYPPGALGLPGLDPDATYEVALLPPGDRPDGNASGWGRPLPWAHAGGVRLTGRALAVAGLRPPELHPDRALLLEARRVG